MQIRAYFLKPTVQGEFEIHVSIVWHGQQFTTLRASFMQRVRLSSSAGNSYLPRSSCLMTHFRTKNASPSQRCTLISRCCYLLPKTAPCVLHTLLHHRSHYTRTPSQCLRFPPHLAGTSESATQFCVTHSMLRGLVASRVPSMVELSSGTRTFERTGAKD